MPTLGKQFFTGLVLGIIATLTSVAIIYPKNSPTVEIQKGKASEDGDSIVTQPNYYFSGGNIEELKDPCEDICVSVVDDCLKQENRITCYNRWNECLDVCDADPDFVDSLLNN